MGMGMKIALSTAISRSTFHSRKPVRHSGFSSRSDFQVPTSQKASTTARRGGPADSRTTRTGKGHPSDSRRTKVLVPATEDTKQSSTARGGESPAQTPSKVLAGLHDENNPAEMTLNLSLDRDRTGYNPEKHLAETLDRVDQEDEEILDEPTSHKNQNRKESVKEARDQT